MMKIKTSIPNAVFALLFFTSLLTSSCQWKPKMAEPPVKAPHGMVASAHPLASQVGKDVLAAGGNAVDAAVACAFALCVVEPYSSGLGGGGFMLIRPGPDAKVEVLDYREIAPARAHRDLYKKDGKLMPGLSTIGVLAIAVPGTVAGLAGALERHGTITLAEAMDPAIALARDGFIVDRAMTERLLLVATILDPCGKKVFTKNGAPYQPGQRLTQLDLARTLQAIAELGPDEFYRGELARTIVSDLAGKGGIMSADDLANYRVRWTEPVRGTYRGYEIVSMPPPSSGGAVVIQTLNLLEGYDLASLGYESPRTVHLMAEAMRLAFADRAAYMGDPAFVDVPLETLVSKEYADHLRQGIDPDRAGDSATTTPGGGVIDPPAALLGKTNGLDLQALVRVPGAGMHTTHLSVVDRNGGAVSLTQTINTTFGSGVMACGTGIMMNNEMDDFAADPGKPNAYGLVQGEANAIAPGKVPLSSMSPTMVFANGELLMVIGSPGGPRIITAVISSIVNVVDFEMDVAAAITAPRIHHQWLPDQIYVEPRRLTPAGTFALSAQGHQLKTYVMPANAQGVLVAPDGSLTGGSDPRGIGRPDGH